MSIGLADIDITAELSDALSLAFGMFWEVLSATRRRSLSDAGNPLTKLLR